MGKKLGEGEFSTVHRGLIGYERVPQPRQGHYARASVVPVAIKVLKGTQCQVYRVHMCTHNWDIMYKEFCFDRVPFCPNSSGHLSNSELRVFYDEIELMKKVSVDSNPHVVKLIGCVTNQSPMAIVLEYATHGDLLHYLRAMGKVHRTLARVLQQAMHCQCILIMLYE